MDTAPKENYIVLGTMFDICHANRDRDEDTVNKNGYPTSKKVKKNYNRIYEFGNTDGTTFCIICESETKGKAILAFWQGICIGQNFLLFEPKQVKDQTLRKDMPVLDVSNPLVPLMDNVPTLLPAIPIREPNQSGEATFFLVQKQLTLLIKLDCVKDEGGHWYHYLPSQSIIDRTPKDKRKLCDLLCIHDSLFIVKSIATDILGHSSEYYMQDKKFTSMYFNPPYTPVMMAALRMETPEG